MLVVFVPCRILLLAKNALFICKHKKLCLSVLILLFPFGQNIKILQNYFLTQSTLVNAIMLPRIIETFSILRKCTKTYLAEISSWILYKSRWVLCDVITIHCVCSFLLQDTCLLGVSVELCTIPSCTQFLLLIILLLTNDIRGTVFMFPSIFGHGNFLAQFK